MPRSQHPVWTCPRCGARLVTKNLWHSCGHFTLEALFGRSDPSVLNLARRFIEILSTLGDGTDMKRMERLKDLHASASRD